MAPTPRPSSSRAAVHLILASASSLRAEARAAGSGFLGEQEIARLARFAAPRRREQFVLGRWLARRALCERFGGDIGDWRLSADAGQPPVVPGRSDIHLSLSHTGNWLVCALATSPVGVDVETIKPARDIHALAEHACADDERQRIASLGDRDARQLFHCYWTLKEAWLKRRRSTLDFALMRRVSARQVEENEADARTWLLPQHALVIALVARAASDCELSPSHQRAAPAPANWRLTLLEA